MAEEKITRKLTTILAADVEGYTRLMRTDEEATLKTLGEYREIIDDLIARHEGRVFSTGGDSVLAEFGSAVEAVRCAISCQEEISSRNAELADDRKMMFRIGINVGDVMVRDGDLFGDGVNVAARLEGLAEPGGVCISGSVFEQIKHKLSLGIDDMGRQEVKNIPEPIRVYRVVSDALAVQTVWSPSTVLPLPDKPSIAVLPFVNMSGDPEQEYFADGLAEDIITTLSKLSDMFVISRNSTFAYKGKATDIRKIAEDLGVGSVLEGSVRKSGDRVRITGQLVDAKTGNHLWAERYDRQLADIFDLQDEITREIVTALRVKLTEGDQIQLRRRQTNSVEAWESYCRGQSYLRRFNKSDNDQAKQAFEEVVATDPKFVSAWSHLAWVHYTDARGGWAPSEEAFERASECAERSLAIDDREPDSYAMLGIIALHQRNYQHAVGLGRRAIELGPSIADNLVRLAIILNFCGGAYEAIQLVDKAMRISPH